MFSKLDEAVSQKLTELRTARGWSQSLAAKKCGMSRSCYMAIEDNCASPRLCTLEKIADGYGIALEDLLGLQRDASDADIMSKIHEEIERHYAEMQAILNRT